MLQSSARFIGMTIDVTSVSNVAHVVSRICPDKGKKDRHPLETLQEFLRTSDGPTLIALDNFETPFDHSIGTHSMYRQWTTADFLSLQNKQRKYFCNYPVSNR